MEDVVGQRLKAWASRQGNEYDERVTGRMAFGLVDGMIKMTGLTRSLLDRHMNRGEWIEDSLIEQVKVLLHRRTGDQFHATITPQLPVADIKFGFTKDASEL